MIAACPNWFEHTVSALAYSLAQPHQTSPELGPPHNDLTRFILTQHGQMPDYLRAPILAATLGFDTIGMLKGGKRFHRQLPEQRARQIAAWKNSRLSFQHDLIRYFESLATLALYSRLERRTEAQVGAATDALSAGSETAAPSSELRAEIVVIGSGPGGAITACLLAEAGRDVLLVEEGAFRSLASCAPFTTEEMLQKYRNGGQTVALGKNKIAYVEGCCVGGGSEINSGLYHRTPPEILARWRRDFQVEALTDADLQPHFAKCEHDVSVSPLPGTAPAASLRLHFGATKLGWKSLEVPRWCRYVEPGSPATAAANGAAGQRQSMSETFIPRFLKAGGRLLPQTRAHRLRENDSGWLIEATHNATNALRIVADTLFLCAGAIHSPALLRRSGITRHIGNSLQVHPTVKMVARFAGEVNTAGMGVPIHQVNEFSPRLSFGCSISSPAYTALGLLDHPAAAAQTAATWPRSANYYAMITSEGHGTVRTLPGFRDPLVRYALTETDRRQLAEGWHKLAQVLLAAGATTLYPSLTRGPVLRSDEDLAQLPDILPAGLANLMTVHLFSSCPMGEDKSKCATDSFGRVHGFQNLFVNDASLLCTGPGVNPQGSIMAIARRNALKFLDKL